MKLPIKILIGLGVLGLLLVIAAIVLPSLLSQANKAKQSEAMFVIDNTVEAQKNIFNKEKKQFVLNFSNLGMGVPEETEKYRYLIAKVENSKTVVSIAQPKSSDLETYVGVVFAENGVANGFTCGSIVPTNSLPDLSTTWISAGRLNEILMCPKGYREFTNKIDVKVGDHDNP